MKKLTSLLAVPLIALSIAGCGNNSSSSAADTIPTGKPADLSVPLPAAIKSEGTLHVGVKCDYPPFGFIDAAGKHAGYGIDIVHQLAAYAFGDPSKVDLVCVNGSNRVPYLESGKIDLIVASMSYTPDRAKVINFSTPYFNSGVRLLTEKGSPIKDFADLKGKTAITIKGTTASIWMKKCLPDVTQQTYNQTSEAVTALTQDRGVAFAQDDTLLVNLAAKNDKLAVTGDAKALSPWGMGTRMDDKEFSAWVDAALKKMQADDFFWESFSSVVKDEQTRSQFQQFVPRPDNTLKYPEGDPYTC